MKRIASLFALLAFFASMSVQAATLTRTAVGDSATGYEPSYANADDTNGDLVTNTDGKTFIHCKNPGAGAATVTVTAQVASVTLSGYGTMTKSNAVLSLAAGEEGFLGPFPTQTFNTSAGKLSITYGGASAADVDIVALQLP